MEYEALRDDLIRHMKQLGSPEDQQLFWIEKRYPVGAVQTDFSTIRRFLFEETELSEDAYSWIDLVLYDQEEVDAINDLCALIERLFARYGERPEAELMLTREWQPIVTLAKETFDLLVYKDHIHGRGLDFEPEYEESDDEYEFDEDIDSDDDSDDEVEAEDIEDEIDEEDENYSK